MNRREFSVATGAVLGAAALGLPGLVLAQGRPEEGRHYRRLEKSLPPDAPAGKIEVIEFFWYSCPHCNVFEPRLAEWVRKQPQDVVFHRVPIAFRDDFVPQQRLYYTLETLGKVDELHARVFDEIHNKRNPTNREETILAFAEKNGLDRVKFQEVYNSFSVQTKARRARQLQDAYEVQGVPAMGVHGRWYTDGDLAGGMERCLQVVEHLVGEARKPR
jgi:thiol:disulfide interchange protein DsbA